MELKVVIPAYNNTRNLRLVLHGLTLQEDKQFHVQVVCDGGPQEPMQAVVEEYKSYLSVDFLYVGPQTKERRLSLVRNTGASVKPHAERVLFLDSDCIPGRRVVALHKAYGCSRVIACGVRYRVAKEDVFKAAISTMGQLDIPPHSGQDDRYADHPRRSREWQMRRLEQLAMMERGVPMPHLCHSFQISYPYKVFVELGGFDKRFIYREDQDLANRAVATSGCSTVILPDAVCYHLDHEVGDPEGRHKMDMLFQKTWPEAPR